MDGIKAKLGSLQFRLALALALVMTVAAIAIGVIGFYTTLHDAHELQDDYLRDIAAMVDTKRLVPDQVDSAKASDLEDPDNHVLVQRLDKAHPLQQDATSMRFPADLANGLHTIHLERVGWRVFVKPLQDGSSLIVAQKTEARNEIAEHAGIRTLLRVLLAIPFLITLLVLLLRWMLRPLARLAEDINARHPEEFRALSDSGLPSELRPFVASINAMLLRIETTLEAQRRFVADAAHELRSPLTALTLQTRNFSIQELPAEARQKLNEFAQGLKRANDLVDQLLTMARIQLAQPAVAGPVALRQVVRRVFEEMMPFAESKKIELGFAQAADLMLTARETDLVTIVRNLVDNAIRYGAPGSKVDVGIQPDGQWLVLTVRDAGMGIPVDQRERVFAPFYRVLGTGQTGSGLGLSIVDGLVRQLHGEIAIDYADTVQRSGTLIRVRIPATLS